MKAGIALHISMVERACNGEFDGNILLLSVPDEEVNSLGMRKAVPVLLELARKHQLDFSLMLNAEPVFSRYPGDQTELCVLRIDWEDHAKLFVLWKRNSCRGTASWFKC